MNLQNKKHTKAASCWKKQEKKTNATRQQQLEHKQKQQHKRWIDTAGSCTKAQQYKAKRCGYDLAIRR